MAVDGNGKAVSKVGNSYMTLEKYTYDPELSLNFIQAPEVVARIQQFFKEYLNSIIVQLSELEKQIPRRVKRQTADEFEEYFPANITTHNIQDFKRGKSPLSTAQRLLIHIYLWISFDEYRVYCNSILNN